VALRGLLLAALLPAAALCGSLDTLLGIERLRRLGSVLMIGAHPDDEETAVLAYLARGGAYRTGYLSLTRGEGGQNLIGSEQGPLLGLIRTHELLAARRIDGASQLFTRAIDFGFSRTAEEALSKWGKEEVLGDVVLAIRRFRPDVVLLVFSGTPSDGHGQHQASAILGKEAFQAAADPRRFPEQIKFVEPWRARRLYRCWHSLAPGASRTIQTAPDRLLIDTGRYEPRLGYSFAELGALSRSIHRSQAMGTALRKGSAPVALTWVAGDRAVGDLFDGIDTTWRRLPGGEAVEAALNAAAAAFRLDAPERAIPSLLDARLRIAAIPDPWAQIKKRELENVILSAAGIWLDASSVQPMVHPGGRVNVKVTAVNRSAAEVSLTGFQMESAAGVEDRSVPIGQLRPNRPLDWTVEEVLPPGQPFTQPYWMREPVSGLLYSMPDLAWRGAPDQPAALQARFRLRFGNQEIETVRPVEHRFLDPVRGDRTRPLAVAPPLSLDFEESSILFPSSAPKRVQVRLRANQAGRSGVVRLEAPPGWTVVPPSREFRLDGGGETAVVPFDVTPGPGRGELAARAETAEGVFRHGMVTLDYEHIPAATVFQEAKVAVVRADVTVLAKTAGYVSGAGDRVPEALRQLGVAVAVLGPGELAAADLSKYDAIVTGVRAFNVRKDLEAHAHRLFEYVARGGTLIVQYNTVNSASLPALAKAAPYRIEFGAGRVTVEDAPMTPVNPGHVLLQAPNRIGPQDYEGWVQERGLYFATSWDPRYEPLWETGDPGQSRLRGATLYARHGRGVYIFTALSWFRQLPAGVPGAARIFANLLSAGKLAQ